MKKLNKRQEELLNFLIKNKKLKYKDIKDLSNNKTIKLIDDYFDNKLSEYDIYKANEYILLKTEKKKYDYLFCAEIGRLDVEQTIFDFKTLYDWDNSWWKFQKDSFKPDKKNGWYIQNMKSYNNIYASGEWFRWIENTDYDKKNKLVYGSLTGLYGFLVLELSQYIENEIEKIYPNFLYKPHRESTFKKVKGSKYTTMFDFETRAGGFENELEDLTKKYRENFYKVEALIEKRIKKYENFTFSNLTFDDFRSTEKIEHHSKDMIIGGLAAMKKISFKTFLDDFYEKEQPYGIVENLIKELKIEIDTNFINKWRK